MLTKILLFPVIAAALIGAVFSGSAGRQKLPVITYHDTVAAEDAANYKGNPYVVAADEFQAQMQYLHENGYSTVTVGQLYGFLYRAEPLPPKSVMITFDDGYEGNYLYAYPILKKYGMHAVMFLITAYVKDSDQVYDRKGATSLSWGQIGAMKDVFEFASHTDNLHKITGNKSELTQVPLPTAQADITASLSKLQTKDIFCFPFGQHNAKLDKLLRQDGVKMAFGTVENYVTARSGVYALPRFTISPDTGARVFDRIVACTYKPSNK